MANAPETYYHYDAPEAYDPRLYPTPASPRSPHEQYPTSIAPNSPPPRYKNDGHIINNDNRYSTYKPEFVAAVTSADSESQAVATEPKRLRDRHVCGIPILWFLFLITLLLVGAIVGGVLGGVLGTKKDTGTDTDKNRQQNEEGPVTTTTSTSSSSTSTSSPPSTPTPKTPPGVLEPRYDAWYYIKNKVINPSHELAWTTNFQNSTQVDEMTIPSGDLWEHWGFWPTEVNSTLASHYREEMNITAVYMLYSRGMVQLNYSISPTEEELDEQNGWWWVEPNPYGGVFIKTGFYGPDRVFTVLDSGVEGEEDVVRYTTSWNTTEDESLRDGQIWNIELAYEMLPGEKTLWDVPPEKDGF